MFYFVIFVVLLPSCSGDGNTKLVINEDEVGINKIVPIKNDYFIIFFSSEASSRSILNFMEVKKLKFVSMDELNKLNNFTLDSVGSNEAKEILGKISKVSIDQSEIISPFFHIKKGQMSYDWGDFMSSWSDGGYVIVRR